MVYIQALIQEKKEQFQGLNVDLKEFREILHKIGEINTKYALDEEVIVQLYNVLFQKQEGYVTIEGIEALILQCLLEEQSQYQKNEQQSQDLDQLEIKSMKHIQLEENCLVSTYQHLNFDSINQILFIYNKALKIAKAQDQDKCELQLILKQIDILNKQGKLLLDSDLAKQIFQMLSCKIEENNQDYVFNNELQQYISKYENYILLNKYGQNNIENYEQAYVFHESEEECTSCDSQNNSQNEINKRGTENNSMVGQQKDSNQDKKSQQISNQQFTSVISSLSNIQDMNSYKYLDNRNYFIENNYVQSMRDLYPVLSEFESKDKNYKGIVEKIQQFYSSLQQEIQNLQQQLYEKDSQIQHFAEIKSMKAQRISEMQKKEEEYIHQISYLEDKICNLQENIEQLNKQIKEYQSKEKEYNQIEQEHDRQVKELKSKDQEIKELKHQLFELKKNFHESKQTQLSQEQEILHLKSKIEKSPAESQNSSLYSTERQNFEQLNGVISYLEDENSQLKQENEQLKQKVQHYVKVIEDNEESNNNLQSEVFTLKKQINEINDSFCNSLNDINLSTKQELSIQQLAHRKSKSLFNRLSWQAEIQQLNNPYTNDNDLVQTNLENDLEQILSNKQIESEENTQNQVKQNDNDQQKTASKKQRTKQISFQNQENFLGDILNDTKQNNKVEQVRSGFKRTNCFSFAALEVIQSYQKLQTKKDVLEQEQYQRSPEMTTSQIPSIQSTKMQLNQEDYMTTSVQVMQTSIQKQNDENRYPESKCTIPKTENTQDKVTPSFQQMLQGDTNFYWNQLNKQLFSNNQNKYNQNFIEEENSINESRKQITIQQFSVLQDFSRGKENNAQTQGFSFPQVNQLINTDNLNLKEDPRVIQIRETYESNLKRNSSENTLKENTNLCKNDTNLSVEYFYSDSIYRINAQNEKERRILFITSQYVYIINPTENFKIVRKFQVRLINRITFSNISSNLCVIHVLNQSDYVIESCRRFDLNIFLKNLFKALNLPTYMISFAENLLIRSKKKDKIFKSPVQSVQNENTENSLGTDQNKMKCLPPQNESTSIVNKNILEQKINANIQSNSFNNKLYFFNIQMKINQNMISNFLFNPWKPYLLQINNTQAIIFKDQKQDVKIMEVSLIGARIHEEMQNKDKVIIFQIKNQTNPILIKVSDSDEYKQLLALAQIITEN
ncbi:hypothetical protein TTHERM_00849500 (macronuclear) [Tetrahymena thermophila SB210]|uniref:TH1 domain-containing protein n=1 Tax=Tetrahymena thermophila (strain SB210) TaxID=312017 RepID=Q23R34_TETTS|nr:hypothetical protein TTHERM_00849500 [Tetrahymena thermophila SB210]EAR99007.3 hypothetical protein TTHERM_00849500 [Tetrahymena thermophila SB210]|eukprot:XP_001019252.3 hypothetical protein TTHERM_00849500 [Tetrahymena thermophila SB210]